MTHTIGRGTRQWLIVGAVLLMAAFAIRAIQFGNPMIEVDENFYLLVGDRMLHGAMPYVDIWDRKPIGLFLLFAGIRLLGGDGILQYQVVATLFVAGTSFLIARIAVRMAGIVAATVAGIIYIFLLGLAGGTGGQASVFYNMLVAAAALLTLKAVECDSADDAAPARIRRFGAGAMLLLGLAMRIKYTVLFEGIFFGLVLLHRSWRASGFSLRLIVDSLTWIAIAVAPTALAFGYYAVHGQTQAFIYANFLSIADRDHAPAPELIARLGRAATSLVWPTIAVALSLSMKPWRLHSRGRVAFGFTMAWLAAAVGGYLLFGTYANHYVIPLFLPMATAGAPAFSERRRHIGMIVGITMLLGGIVSYPIIVHKLHRKRGDAHIARAVVAAIRPRLTNCLYVWNGDPIFYHLTGSCLPGHYPFPSHLNQRIEARAIGVDPVVELRRVLAERPSVILDQKPRDPDLNPASIVVVDSALRAAYRPVATVPLKGSSIIVYERIIAR